jgi:thioredoxin-like negative regulator of GroEL
MSITHINDTSQFNKFIASATYTVVDFYADWCGPCRAIAPLFAKLAQTESKPGRLQFCKVDVDACQDVARKYGVTA